MPTAERADYERAMRGQTAFDGNCTARRRREGKPCQGPGLGAVVCPGHGASAPQVKTAAKRRLDQAANVLVQRLLRYELDGEVTDAVALQAIRDALDRAGVIGPKTLEVNVGPKAWEAVFDDITSGPGSRAQSCRNHGVSDADMALELPAADT